MFICPTCGHGGTRKRRSPLGKILNRVSYRCRECDTVWHVRRSFLTFMAPGARCPKCGTQTLSVRSKYDKIDAVSWNPLRYALAALKAPIYHCTFCRYQFRDLRSKLEE